LIQITASAAIKNDPTVIDPACLIKLQEIFSLDGGRQLQNYFLHAVPALLVISTKTKSILVKPALPCPANFASSLKKNL